MLGHGATPFHCKMTVLVEIFLSFDALVGFISSRTVPFVNTFLRRGCHKAGDQLASVWVRYSIDLCVENI